MIQMMRTSSKTIPAENDSIFPKLCQLTDDDAQGFLRFEIDKSRIRIRLTAPYSKERRKAASEFAKKQGFQAQIKQ